MPSPRLPRTHHARVAFSLVALLTLGVVVEPARATVMVEVPIEELAREAHAIVRGVVTRVGTRMVARRGSLDPHTFVRLRVHEWLKGRGGRTVRLRELGGVGRVTALAIDGAPRYEVGAEVIAFLEVHDGVVRTLALSQGQFTVRRNVRDGHPVVTRDLHGIGFARFDRKGITVEGSARVDSLALDELLRVIELAPAYGGNDGMDLTDAGR
jgi:hypothetical protein